ncbi:hypothetical protein R4Z09_14070 [Niallia oryzisoli]|uniref:Uncharacterized protein n=1 Tax=Niallia oryzisoli TaxID=1737571 RepID=A0ABZ2CKU4_9BACI
MKNDQFNKSKRNDSKELKWYERLFEKNMMMNWGILSLSESVQPKKTRNN